MVGYAYAGPYRPRPAYRFTVENSVYLQPAIHRRGIGLQLLQRLIAESEARGYRQMIAVIGDSANAGSIGVHTRMRIPDDRDPPPCRLTLERVAAAMAEAARAAGVAVVTGDTKVVERGKGDGLYITTAGVGVINHGLAIAPTSIRPGDAVLLSGDIGRHGMAILATREGLAFENPIESDCAALTAPVQALLRAGLDVHCLRDLTRGGLATALIELAESSRLAVAVDGQPA